MKTTKQTRMQNARKKQEGYLLIESMVTLVLVSFALLGLTGMFVRGVDMNRSSYYRSLAMQKAYDIGDRIYANAASRADYAGISGAASSSCTECIDGACTAADLAAFDSCNWRYEVGKLLPSGQGTVTSDGNGTFTITVAWDDQKQGTAQTNVAVSMRY